MNRLRLRQNDVEKYLPNYYFFDEQTHIPAQPTLSTVIAGCGIIGIGAVLFLWPITSSNTTVETAEASIVSENTNSLESTMISQKALIPNLHNTTAINSLSSTTKGQYYVTNRNH